MGTHYAGNTREQVALDLFIKFARAHNAVFSKAKKAIKEHGLTEPQFFHYGTVAFFSVPKNNT